MKKLVIFLMCMVAGYCVAQTSVKASNDTLYFEGTTVYVPKYDVEVKYLNKNGQPVNINSCANGVYIREIISKNMNFKLVEFYVKNEKREKQVKAWRYRQDQG